MKKLLLVLALCLAAASAPAGETIRVILANLPWSDSVKTMVPAFEKETGIKVSLESYGEDQLNQKLAVEFAATRGATLDVFMSRPLQEALMMKKNGWYEDLTPFIGKDKEYDFADYTESSVNATRIGGVQTMIPILLETQILFYRKDLFAAKGLTPPTTFAELEAAAEKLTDRPNGISGIVMRGQRAAMVTIFSSFLYGFGGDFYDQKTRKALIDTPEFLEAANFYGGLLRKYGPDGVLNMHWMQALAVFTQGKAAMYYPATSLTPSLIDPAKSPYAEQTGFALFPAGPKAHKVFNTTPWGIAMSSGSQKKDAAWQFIRYMTSKEATLKAQGEFSNPCARKSVYGIPEGVKKFPPEWVKAVNASAAIGVGYDRPYVIAVSESRDVIGEVIVSAIEGKDPAPAAKKAQEVFQGILDREK